MEFKLPKAVKTKWVKALRSGEYRQGRKHLVMPGIDETEYCCLGVACKVGLTRRSEAAGCCELVSTRFIPLDIQTYLADKNDYQLWSFKKIANWIEKNL